MCLILFAHRCRADLPLVLLANRDEFLERASAPAAPWPAAPGVVGGRDLVAGGSWLGLASDGRWAAVTNVRDGERSRPGGPSRGWLVRDYLAGRAAPQAFARQAAELGGAYAGFNLLLGKAGEVWSLGNRGGEPVCLAPGVYGLSNGRLDTPWPKVERGKAALAALLDQPAPVIEDAFRLLADTETFPDRSLPATGVPLAWERALSATFIAVPGYGTRCSTVLLQSRDGRSLLVERSFAGTPQRWSQRSYRLDFVAESDTNIDRLRSPAEKHGPESGGRPGRPA